MTVDQKPVVVNAEPAFFDQTWDLSYRHALGTTVGGFLHGLTERRLLGRRCPACSRVLFPARSFCDRCHQSTTDWIEVGLRGTIEMFTIVTEDFPGMREPAPYVIAYVLLEGADTAAVGYVRGLDLTDVAAAAGSIPTGTIVDVRFSEHPEGQITDFWYEVAPS
jgi:uncharacterized OB-fold protein